MTDILTTDHLTKKFGGLCAVDDVSFSLGENLIMGLIGPNGAGKTTLINMISGAIAPSQGRILFEGRDITGRKSHAINNMGVARTFQVVRIFSKLTVIDNVIAALVDRRRKGPWRLAFESVAGGMTQKADLSKNQDAAEKLLEFVGIGRYRDELAENLPYALTKRLEIARALATRPKLLLLDEPSSGLNPAELIDQIALIRDIQKQGVTILIIEHVMKVIMDISDRLIVLHYGKKIAEGAPQTVYTDPNVVQAYLGGESHAAH
jgi:ABC-type branched-subunit amino acid transport system ATPase component